MKRVKMLACMAGSGFVRNVGDLVDVPEAEAGRLIAAGFAEDAPTSPVVVVESEVATVKKVEEQPKPRGRPRANRETPAAQVVASAEPPAVEAPAVTEPPTVVPEREPSAAPPS